MKTQRQILAIIESDSIAMENLAALYDAAKKGIILQDSLDNAHKEIIRRALERDHKAAQAAYERRKYAKMEFDYRFNSVADKFPVNIRL